MEIYFIAALIGVVVGGVVGLLGAGGGILSVPILTYFLGFSPAGATTGSLAIILATAAISLIPHTRRGTVGWREGAIFGVLSIAGSAAASRVATSIDGHVLMSAFAAMLFAVGVSMVWRGWKSRPAAAGIAQEPAPATKRTSLWVLAALATLIGLLTGFFGVGGGFVVVPVLTLAMGFSFRRAVGTSLLVIMISSASGLVSRIGTDVEVNWSVVAVFACGSMVGGLAGGKLGSRLASWVMSIIFGCLLFVVSLATGAVEIPQLL